VRDEGTLAIIRRKTDVASLLTFNLAQAFALS
jgi:hypothetical protein